MYVRVCKIDDTKYALLCLAMNVFQVLYATDLPGHVLLFLGGRIIGGTSVSWVGQIQAAQQNILL